MSEEPRPSSSEAHSTQLQRCRVIGFINGLELFGHERSQLEVFKTLRDLGAEVQVAVNAFEEGGAVGAEARRLGFATMEIPFGFQWSRKFFRNEPSLVFTNLGRVGACSWRLRQKLSDFRPTHLHIGNALVYSYIAPVLATNRVPLIFRVGEMLPTESWPQFVVWKRCARRAAQIVAISKFLSDAVSKHAAGNSSKIATIYNLSPIPPNGNPRPAQKSARVVFVGQMDRIKGVHVLLEAAKRVAAKHPSVCFDFVGGSRFTQDFEYEMRGQAQAFGLSDRLNFHGHVENPRQFYDAATVHVAPSIVDEGCGNVIMEAKCSYLPSVVFPSGALPELVHHKVDGYVCRDKTVESLVEGISWFLDDPNRCRAAGIAASKDYAERFGAERFAAQWADVYRRTLKCK